jgi:plastocyanin
MPERWEESMHAQRRSMRLTKLALVAVPAVLIALFLASAAVAGAAQAATVTVQMGDNTFTPDSVTVNVGDTVTWNHVGNNPHDVTADNGAFSSPRRMANGQSFSWTATAPGTFTYTCTIHAARGMKGTIVVQGAGGGAPAAAPRTGGGGMATTTDPRLPWLALAALGLTAATGLGVEFARRRRSA